MPPVAVSVALTPAHTVSLLTDGVGLAFTVTDPLAVALQPDKFVAVTEYVPAKVDLMLAAVSPLLHA
jgi:hypothetical protein